ncbi:redoxin domain-containing protein [Campylobacter sp. RM12640]|uniref:TlpA family protein disulfide reductase n=1 Tax=unclassified Campylobacter TaxID=2593542 RepID=UPI001BDA6A9D|nr:MULTISPECIES: thioredoxin-like domain-containing protein [unclassified Campylobacter]MBZ7975658.1 redoxin domain-containing protein [Campylobacter sp. RM12637]MBZ7980504.1 redoxin domain-containing protein [Campylobacter sp. RM12642]MBZ7980941.1 redoxin domain-containing protein [Campylobacter sp. RM12640]MBZ7983962.1 redoxin domain-containing protein [Campylobacter sp. RM12647]MBZ7988260.1 redoxin domain-containing protein [Campylobacter sp. RM12635]MBZ7991424.1 redoxin domain-containing 
MNKILIVLILLFFVSCEDNKLVLNKQAPNILAKTTALNKIELKRQGIELIEFWQNGCAACLKVMAGLNEFANENNISIYAINSIDDLNTIKKHELEHQYSNMIFLKDEEDISWSRYDIFAVPTLFILKDGVYVDKVLGDRSLEFLTNKIKEYL